MLSTNKQTDGQTNTTKNITSFAKEVTVNAQRFFFLLRDCHKFIDTMDISKHVHVVNAQR